MELEFRHLRVIKAVADRRTLTAAARELRMAQPTVTETMQQAERIVGGPLFRRSARGAVATALGEIVAAHARKALLALQRLDDLVEGRSTGVVRIAAIPFAHKAYLLDLVPRVLGREADVRTVHDVEQPLELVTARQIEAGFVHDLPGHEHELPHGVLRTVVAVEPLLVAMSERHPLACRQQIDLADLAGARWLVMDLRRSRMPRYLTSVCAAAGVDAVVRRVDQVDFSRLATSDSAVAPVTPGARRRSRVVFRPLTGNPLRCTTSLVHHVEGDLVEGEVRQLWEGLSSLRRKVVQSTEGYREWMSANPGWTVTPPEPVRDHDPIQPGLRSNQPGILGEC
ncbi:LysR family transcriptional regulator [Lentzea sp. JNUCC 0626]|uniref:LysR family transcriptional regulator n=1 Tax=Lentzea sp. JNUCC 0626 TaxID=3367513 RepID=UPI00374A88B1